MTDQESAARYFGGSTVKTNLIRPLSARTFADLIDTTFAVGYQIKATRGDYAAATPSRKKLLKDGPYVLPARFTGDEPRRGYADAASAVLVCVDVDDSALSAALRDDPATFGRALPWNHVAHETASSTQDEPRLRVVIEADDIPLPNYVAALRTVAARLGLPEEGFDGMRESQVAVQPMYRPAVFEGETDPPILSVETTRRAMTLADVDLSKGPSTDPADNPEVRPWDALGLPLEHLPLTHVEPDHVSAILSHLDPDMPYPDWVRVCCALKHQFSGSDDAAAEGFRLFAEWSSTGTKWPGDRAAVTKWNSFDPAPKGRTPVTIRTLISMGRAAGWDPTPLEESAADAFDRWLAAQDSHRTILRDAPAKLAGLPDTGNEGLMDVFLGLIVKRCSDLGAKVTKGAIKASARKASKDARMREARESSTPPWLRSWVYDGREDCFRNTRSSAHVRTTPAGFNRLHSSRMVDLSGMMESGRPRQEASDHALNIARIKLVDGTVYDPRQRGEEPFFELNGRTYLNTYMLSSLPGEDPDNAELAGRYVTEIAEAVCGPAAAMMLDFLTVCVRHPGRKIRWAPVLQSAQGGGKNLLLDAVRYAVGDANFNTATPAKLQSQWNDWMLDAHIVNVDELHTTGGIRGQEMNAIKSAITNQKITVNQKFRDTIDVPNVVNFVLTTNYLNSLKLEDSDRRYWVVESPLQRKEQVTELTKSGFYRERATWFENHKGAIRSWFLSRPIPKDFPYNGPAPDSAARTRLVDYSRSSLYIQIEDLLDRRREPMVAEDLVVLSFLRDHVEEQGNRHGSTLEEMGFVRWERDGVSKFRIGKGLRTSIYYRPELFDLMVETPVEAARDRLAENIDKSI